MTARSYIVVADKFAEFAVDKEAITLTHLRSMVTLPEHVIPGRVRLVPGQGVSDQDILELVRLIDSDDALKQRWDIEALRSLPRRAASTLSHKHKAHNTLICPPVAIGGDRYAMDLRIDQDCELMDDHQTGQHVQGMVLIEASRQAFLAVTEEFFLKGLNIKTYFVINAMKTEFLGFVFPVQAQLAYQVVSKDINDRRQKFEVEIEIIQSSEVRARTTVSFTVYPDAVISKKEADLASYAAALTLKASAPHGQARSRIEPERVPVDA